MPLSSDRHIIDRQFKAELENYGVRPYTRVWTRIAQSLQFKERKSAARKVTAMVGVLLLIGSSAGVYESYHHTRQQQFAQEVASLRVQPANTATSIMVMSESPAPARKPSRELSTDPLAQLSTEIQFPVEATSEEENETSPLHSLKYRDLPSINPADYPDPDANHSTKSLMTLADDLFVGITFNLNTTWLYDQQAIASENLKYKFTSGTSFGLQGGFHFAKRWGLQTAWLINSKQGQNYENLDLYGRTTNLDFTNKSISLTYMNLPLMVQYRILGYSGALRNSYEMSLLVGGQYGQLLSYSVNGVKGEINNDDLIKNSEFAVVTGFDYDLMTDNPVFYTIGLRASFGTNIFNEEVPNYFEFSKPHNFIIGLHGAVNFGLSK